MKIKSDAHLICPDIHVELNDLKFPLEYLYRGTLIVGQPGSGKTRYVLMPLLRSILTSNRTSPENKAALIVADPKNELCPFIESEVKGTDRESDIVKLEIGSSFYNPLNNPFLTESEIVEKLISFSETTNRNSGTVPRDDIFWENSKRSLLSSLVVVARLSGELTFRSLLETHKGLLRCSTLGDAMSWLTKRGVKVPDSALQGIKDYFQLPETTTRPCVAASVSNTLFIWEKEPLVSLVNPGKGAMEIDPISIIDQGKILIIACTGAAFGVSVTPILLALKEHFFAAMLSRDQIEVHAGESWDLINQSRPVFFVADEFQSYLNPGSSAGEVTALDRLRGFRGGYIAATQNLASISSVMGGGLHSNRLVSLFSNQIYLANLCPETARLAEHIMGKKEVREKHRSFSSTLPPPLLFREKKRKADLDCSNYTELKRKIPRVDACVLACMKTGEYWFRVANGQVYHRRHSFA